MCVEGCSNCRNSVEQIKSGNKTVEAFLGIKDNEWRRGWINEETARQEIIRDRETPEVPKC